MKNRLSIFALTLVQLAFFAQNKNFVVSGDVFGRRVFIENKGQFNDDIHDGSKVKYAYINGVEKVYFSPTGLTYYLEKVHPLTHRQRELQERGKPTGAKPAEKYYINVSWENANPNTVIEESEKQSWYHSFGGKELKSNCYKKITYKNVYPNIDIEYVFTSDKTHGIKYNVILNPGSNINDVKIKYSGDVKGITLKKGNVIIKTPVDDIVEHAPISLQNNTQVASNFVLSNDIIGFALPNGYNTSQKLIIDPWVTNLALATNNYGYDVDYDYFGNYYVFGGTGPFLISKYSPVGALIWTFAGVVAAQGWTSLGDNPAAKYIGNFVVDKFTGKSFEGEGVNNGVGTRIVRIDANGLYDNFITTGNINWNEVWDMSFYCNTGTIFGLGGSTASNASAGIVNQTNSTILAQNFTGLPSIAQDIVSHAIDPAGTVFFAFASIGEPGINNNILRANATFNGNVWNVPSTYTSFNEGQNKDFYIGSTLQGCNSNGFNALAASANYLYYYDGFNLAAYNKTTGARIGFTTITGNNVLEQGGIAVDNCENVYIGGNNAILSYHFNGTTFSALPSIPSGATTPNKYVYDIKLDESTNLLYVSGSGFGGVYTAINSTTCTTIQLSITPICMGTAIASLTTNIPAPLVTYSWTNSGGVVVSSTSNSPLLTNTATALANGNYTLSAQINAPCGAVITQTFNINCVCSVTAAASNSCVAGGISTSLSLGDTLGYSTAPLTYTWAGPGGFSTTPAASANQTLATAATGLYTLTVISPGCSSSGTVLVTSPSQFTPAIVNMSVSCNNGSNATASVSAITGTSTAPYTYSWSTTQTLVQITGLTAGNYTCLVTDAIGCSFTATTAIAQPAQAFLTLANTPVACINASNGTASVATIPIANTGPYTYTWSTNPVQNFSIAIGLTVGTYSCILQDNIGCTFTGTTTIVQPAQAFLTLANTPVACSNANNGTASVATIPIANTGPYTYTWSTNPVQTSSIAIGLTVGTYSCILQDNIGCIFTGTTTITQLAQAFLTLANTSVSCNNGSNGTASVAAIPVANTGPYTYSWSTNPVQITSLATGLTAGSHTCTVTDALGCTYRGTTTLVQPTSVSVTISTNTTQACVGVPINFTATGAGGTGAYTYSWSSGSFGATAAITELNGGSYTYTLTARDANTCSATAIKTVSFIPSPVLSSSNRTICSGQSTNLYVNGASNYSWSPSSGLNTTFGNAVIASNAVTTVYTIVGSNAFCTGSTNVTVSVIPYPDITLSSSSQEICYGNSTPINVSGAMGYNWSPNYAINSLVAPSVVVSPSVSTNYTVTSYNFSGTVVCSITNMMPIVVVPQVTPTISNNKIICIGDKVTLQAGGGNTFNWAPSAGLNQTNVSRVVASPSVTTIYMVYVSSNGSCGKTATVLVKVKPKPQVFAGRDTTFNLDEPMFINATGTGTLTWVSGEGIFCKVCPETKIVATQTGCYVIEAITEFGCKASDEVCIEVTTNYGVYIPNSFTPNDDGLNDVFLVQGYSLSDVKLEIFDRWGEKLFSSNDQKLGWNGTYKGTVCKNDVYVYNLSYKGLDGKRQFKTGHVSVTK